MVLSVSGEKITCVQSNIDGYELVWWGDECSDGHRYFNYSYKRSTLKEIYNTYNGKKGDSGYADGKIRVWKPSESLKQNADYYNGGALKISGQSVPSKITQGSSWSCKGTITSGYTITHVGGYILKYIDGEENIVYSKTVNPGTTSYSLLNIDVDKALLFNKLSAGTYYYKITAHDSSGKRLTLINAAFDVSGTSTLSISNKDYPKEVTLGSDWTCQGKISSNYNINQVSGYILGNDNSTVLYSKTVNPSARSYSLANGEIDKALLFNKLEAGSYYYKITAKDTSGKSLTLINEKFNIDSPCNFSGEITSSFPNGSIIESSSLQIWIDAEDSNEIENITLSVTGPEDSQIEYDWIYDGDFDTKRKMSYRIKYTKAGDYKISAIIECGNKELHEIVYCFSYDPKCNFTISNCNFRNDKIIKNPYEKLVFDAYDENGNKEVNLYLYNAENNVLVGKSHLTFTGAGNKSTFIINTDIARFPEGKYREQVEMICNAGNVHEVRVWEFEYVFPVISFVQDENIEPIAMKYDYRTEFVMPDDPIRKGYIFDGWYTEPEGKGERFTSDTEVRDDLTIYANWIVDSENYGDVIPEDISSYEDIPEGIWVAGTNDYTYTGSKIKQTLRVYDGKKHLNEGIDYVITYKNNKNAYTYLDGDYEIYEEVLQKTGKHIAVGSFDPKKAPQAIIQMKGNYSGRKNIYFRINPLDISGKEFKANTLTYTYTGKKQTPAPKLTWNGKALKYGTDFYIPEYDAAKKDKTAFKDTGTYNLTITGKKNFTGEIPVTLTISESKKQIAMNKVKVTGIKNKPWTGDQIVQTGFSVKYGKDVLSEENGDYTIEWGENTDAGTGTVTFIGTGTDEDGDGFSYIGSKKVSFKINGTAMSKVKVSGVKKSYPYTGAEIEPEASLTYRPSKNAQEISLTEGTHYTAVYQKNVDKGTATVLFTGLASGGYTGTKKVTFKITSAGVGDTTEGETTIENIQIAFADAENIQDGVYVAPYMKGGAKPEVIVTSGDKTLEAGKDYKVSYSNNKKPALSTDAKAPTVTVTGKGNYKGSKSETFTIEAKALSNENGITVVAKDKVENLKKNGYRQSFKVYDKDGKALGNKDYDTSTVTYTLIRKTNEDGTASEVNEPLGKNSIVPAGSIIRITVQGKGIYAGGEASGTYRILEKNYDISKATIQINNQPYTGNAILITDQSQFKVGKVFIKIGNQKKELILGQDIEVVRGSYVKNVNKGTAKVTFRGINDFGGTKTVSFKIGARSITDFWKGIYAKMAELWN